MHVVWGTLASTLGFCVTLRGSVRELSPIAQGKIVAGRELSPIAPGKIVAEIPINGTVESFASPMVYKCDCDE